MNEYRRARRRRCVETIDVFDTMTEHSIGTIGNLSESGMLVLSSRRLFDDALFQFRFQLTDVGGRKHTIEVGAHQLWSDAASQPGQNWAGYRFIDIGPSDATLLRAWIDQPGGQYV